MSLHLRSRRVVRSGALCDVGARAALGLWASIATLVHSVTSRVISAMNRRITLYARDHGCALPREPGAAGARELIASGAAASRISVTGRGLREPIASNATAAGRAENRRVEIVITPTS